MGRTQGHSVGRSSSAHPRSHEPAGPGTAGQADERADSWITEVTAERTRAERSLRTATPKPPPSPSELRAFINGFGDVATVLESADPGSRADLYGTLGLRLTWHPDQRKVLVEAQPTRVLAGGVGGGT